MDSKFYVSLEAARLLKEKGYNEECDCVIDDDGDIFEHQYQMNQDLPEWKCSCPTKAEAIDWLESKGIIITTDIYYVLYDGDSTVTTCWGYHIIREDELRYRDNSSHFLTRLEAEDAAIIKALDWSCYETDFFSN
jgi:hypothetical protein